MMQKTPIFIILLCLLISFKSYGQTERDTLFYEIQPDMIAQTRLLEDKEETEYRIFVNLKEDYHSEYEQLTRDNIGNFLAVVYKGEILSPLLPVIQASVPNGHFSIPFKKKEKAKKVMQQIGVR